MISKTEFENFKKKFDVVSVFIENNEEILLLHRQDHKPQGNIWALVAGKVDNDEELADALVREIQEEIGLKFTPEECQYFEKYYVRYPEYDFIYHTFHLPLKERPTLNLNLEEHKDHRWLKPEEALKLDLIPDEDVCIKGFYNIV
ncbi:MAG: NUDIX domain-containing protein [Candidatus Pacebacteria bacterium]|nr:NUDIX domain-containing protein [Candidatus Paceibacterota bacterium]